jgi:hypothetical protein
MPVLFPAWRDSYLDGKISRSRDRSRGSVHIERTAADLRLDSL